MTRPCAAVLCSLLAGCSSRAGTDCAPHPSLGEARELALRLDLLPPEERATLEALEVCALPGAEPVLAGARARVDESASTSELAAQLVHLAAHATLPEGARCTDPAADERRAYELERAARLRLGLPPLDPSREARAVADREARCAAGALP